MDRITIFGGSGFLGRKLIDALSGKFDITVATRNATGRPVPGQNVIIAIVDDTEETYLKAVEGSFAVINLSGASIAGKRWNAEYKKILYDSRINTTRNIVNAIGRCAVKPYVFISTSASGYYGDRKDEILTEESGPGSDFLSTLCSDWETEALKAEKYEVRTVCVRIGVVLDKSQGALPELIAPFKFFAGGKLGNGKQWMPWIHIDDLTGIFVHALDTTSITGPVNAVSPEPVRNSDFAKLVGKALHRPSFFAVPGFALKIAAGEFAEFLLGGQRIVPAKLTGSGYVFKYTETENALNNLLR